MGVTSGLIRSNLADDPPDGPALPDPAQHVIRLRGYLRAQNRLPALGLGLAALASSGCLLAAGFSAPDPWAELVMLLVMSVAWLGTQLWMDGLDIRAGVRRAQPIISTVRKARIDLGRCVRGGGFWAITLGLAALQALVQLVVFAFVSEGRVIVGIFAGFAVGQLLYGELAALLVARSEGRTARTYYVRVEGEEDGEVLYA